EHVLLVTQHHIVSDGWSIGVLIQEVAALYAAFRLDQPDPLPPLALQYADYAAWQRQWLHGEVTARQLAFWKQHLEGAPAYLELPTDRPRPLVQRHAGASLPIVLPAPLVDKLQAVSRRHGVTPFMTLLAAWSLVLARLSGQHEVVVGTPVANRQRTEVEPLIGFFVNTLALRVRLDEDPTVADLLAQVRHTTLTAYEHQDLPFEQVVEALQPVRSLSHSPLFQVMLALDNTPLGQPLALPGLTLSPVEQAIGSAHFDLSLSLHTAGERMEGQLTYASDLFQPGTAQRWIGYFLRLLQAMLDAPQQQHLSTLDMLDDAERRHLLVDFNATAQDYPHDRLIHQLFEEQAARTPQAIALVCDTQTLTYAELDARANRLAHSLIGLGVGLEDRVAMLLQRRISSVVAMLAVLKAGATYVPLDATYPPERVAQLLADCRPTAVVTEAGLHDRLPTDAPSLILIEDDATQFADLPHTAPSVSGLTAHALAYIIYTSGSTGVPKGVMVEHRSVLRLVMQTRYAALEPTDVVAHGANPAFDAATWEVWAPLLHGAALCVVPHEVMLDPAQLRACLQRHRVTALWLTVGLFNQYVDMLDGAFAQLRYLLIGGDVLDPRRVAQLLSQPQRPQQVINAYGPTETTTFATTFRIDAVPHHAHSIPIGRPIANTQVYVLDAARHPVPLGAIGELYIGGPGVARGYLNRPDLTAERFLPDPFSDQPDARMYRTGDLGRWRPDGTLEYHGRNDFQVKLRGFRIELGEIEAQLSACAGVRDALVAVREDTPGDKRLVAYLIAQPEAELHAAALREHLAHVLPEYMLPAAFVTLPAFPLTPNGKRDRKALPAPDHTALATKPYEAPQGPTEPIIAEIWQDLLGVERVGRHDHFFELGGHSLLATQFVARVRECMEIELPLKALFMQPTLIDIADVITELQLALYEEDDIHDIDSDLATLVESELLAMLKENHNAK
ncbi:non-ribosomal peptide synthetase, partial [Xanthomonas sontii]|uniref:non-ribosomal peptide synthetase n=1 Tax=Xanthomonas sontii TaxID=2650745 RepID=UPI0027F7ABD7